MHAIIWVLTAILVLGGANWPRKFPKVDSPTISGEAISAAYFERQPTMVILMHLGCPPAMVLLKDLQSLDREELNGYQVLVMLENTAGQVAAFNSPLPNDWSDMRRSFHLDSIQTDLIAECEEARIEMVDGNMVVRQQCRKTSRKLLTRSSPSIYLVDTDRRIIHSSKGYLMRPDPGNLAAILKRR